MARWLLALNAVVAVMLGGWYVAQPESRQQDVRRLVQNTFQREKRVSVLNLAWDIWQLYYADSAAGKIASGDKSKVYGGAPKAPASAGDVRVLVNRGYVVGYSESLVGPVWAAYRVQDLPRIPEPPRRPDKFETDRRTTARVRSDVYSSSGYDRGHLAPNYAIATRYGAAAQRETFLMSNVTPQRHALNAGAWRELEMRIATSYPARYAEVWVITGPVFGPNPPRLRGGVAVPEAFFSIIVDENEGRLRTLALLVPHVASGNIDLARCVTSIDEIQRRTGLDFLSELDDAAELEVEAGRAARVW